MKGISTFNADYLQRQYRVDREISKGKWVAARPEGKTGLRNRFKRAWQVFTGKADVLVWTEQ